MADIDSSKIGEAAASYMDKLDSDGYMDFEDLEISDVMVLATINFTDEDGEPTTTTTYYSSNTQPAMQIGMLMMALLNTYQPKEF